MENTPDYLDIHYKATVTAIIGKRGSGKTTIATRTGYTDFTTTGRKVIANYQLNFPYVYMPYSEIIELPDELQNALVILDEGSVGMNSRRALSKNNIKMTEFIVQVRKRHCDVIIIAQTSRMLDVNIRDQIDYVIRSYAIDNNRFFYQVFDRTRWGKEAINEFIFNATEFFKLKLFDTHEVIKYGDDVVDNDDIDLTVLTVKELKQKAKFLGLSRYSSMNKDTLIGVITKALEVKKDVK